MLETINGLPKVPIIGLTLLLLYMGAPLLMGIVIQIRRRDLDDYSEYQHRADRAMWVSMILGLPGGVISMLEIIYMKQAEARSWLLVLGALLSILIAYQLGVMVYNRLR